MNAKELAKQLRIGNRVKYIGGQAIVENGEAIMDIEEGLDIAEPIPLTEEWLVKLGFWHDDYYNSAKRFVSKSPIILIEGNGYYTLCHYPICKIQYVHQLQNLYFALTGEELTYTP